MLRRENKADARGGSLGTAGVDFGGRRVDCSHFDATDWAILQGLAEGKTQGEVARELGLSQQAVSKRLRVAWRRLCQELGFDYMY